MYFYLIVINKVRVAKIAEKKVLTVVLDLRFCFFPTVNTGQPHDKMKRTIVILNVSIGCIMIDSNKSLRPY